MTRAAKRLLRLIIAIPLLLLLVLFALTPSNRVPVDLGLWPTDIVWVAPLSIVVLAAAALFFLLGALLIWVGSLGQRLRARRAENRVRILEAQLAAAPLTITARPVQEESQGALPLDPTKGPRPLDPVT